MWSKFEEMKALRNESNSKFIQKILFEEAMVLKMKTINNSR